MCEYCGCQTITAVLGPHTAVEEDGLFPAMAADFPEHIADLTADHRRIEGVLGAAEWDAVDAVRARVGSAVPIRAG
jgi:hypothetical protein